MASQHSPGGESGLLNEDGSFFRTWQRLMAFKMSLTQHPPAPTGD